jgi:hypothetical protein
MLIKLNLFVRRPTPPWLRLMISGIYYFLLNRAILSVAAEVAVMRTCLYCYDNSRVSLEYNSRMYKKVNNEFSGKRLINSPTMKLGRDIKFKSTRAKSRTPRCA